MNLRKYITPQLCAFLVLAGATGYTFEKQHEDVISAKTSLAQTTYNVLHQGCVSGNQLRVTLQGVIRNPGAIEVERLLVKEGRLTQADLNLGRMLAAQEAQTIAPRDCSKAYAALKPKP